MQSKRDARTGEDSEGTDEQASSPLHVLSDAAQKEGDFGQHPAKRLAREDNRGTSTQGQQQTPVCCWAPSTSFPLSLS